MLKTLEKELVEQVEKDNPGCFFITSEDNDEDVLIIFKKPGKQELKKYRTDFEKQGLAFGSYEMLYNCLLAPEVNILRKELEDDYYLQIAVREMFSRKILRSYADISLGDMPEEVIEKAPEALKEELKNKGFSIKNNGIVISSFVKPGKILNKKFQRQQELGNKKAFLELMLDCVYPKEDRKRVETSVQEDKLLEDALLSFFIIKISEHVKIRG